MEYNHQQIEKSGKINGLKLMFSTPKKIMIKEILSTVEFPYPSGQGLHVGHPRSYTALDVVARLKRMQGFNVLFPIGFDAFGLPTERYAIKNHMDPEVVTKKTLKHLNIN